MEACWLAAVVCVPLAYNPHGIAGFQPFKMALVRSLASVLAAAWLVRIVENSRPRVAKASGRPPLLTVLWAGVGLVAAMQIVATLFSVEPALSFWGFSANRGGLLSFLAELVIFAALATHLRSAAQLDRLVTAIILPTIPISLFAVAQHCGFDSLSLDPSAQISRRGVLSLAGHQISLAAHLGMVIPFTLARIVAPARRRSPALLHGAILLLQVTAMLLAKSRGPLLAGLAAGLALVVAWAVLSGKRSWLLRGGVAALLVGTFLVVLGLPQGPLAPLARLPGLDRLAEIVPIGRDTDVFRSSLWRRAPETVLPAFPFTFPDGHRDLPPAVRSAIGFGPESLQGILPSRWTWIDPQRRLEKSFHNLVWDTWFTQGALGAAAMLLLFAAGILRSFRPLGFRAGKRETVAGLACGIGLCAATVGIFGWGYLGLGLQAGLAAGLIAALAGFAAFSRVVKGEAATDAAPLVVAAGAALIVHLVETGFAFPVASSALLFWISLAIIAGAERGFPAPRVALLSSREHGIMPLLSGLALTGLTFAFLSLDHLTPLSWREIFVTALTRIPRSEGGSHLLPLVLIPSAIGFSLLAATGAPRPWPVAWRTFGVGAVLATGYAVVKAVHLAIIGPLPGVATPLAEILRHAACIGPVLVGFFVVCGGIVGFLGWACARPVAPGAPAFSRRGSVAAAVAALAVLATLPVTSLRFVLADAHAFSAGTLAASPYLNTQMASLDVLENAIRCDPISDEHRVRFSDTCTALAAGAQGAERDALVERAIHVLAAGHALSALNPTAYSLGRLHLFWALWTRHPDLQKSRALEARRYFDLALRFDPTAEHIWVESAAVDGALLGDAAGDETRMRQAAPLIEPAWAGPWGEAYAAWSVHALHPELRQRYAERGIFHFRRALDFPNRQGGRAFALHLGKGTLHRNLGQLPEALAEFQAALTAGPAAERWRAEAMLAHTLGDLGDKASALTHAAAALDTAPPDFHDALRELQAELGQR